MATLKEEIKERNNPTPPVEGQELLGTPQPVDVSPEAEVAENVLPKTSETPLPSVEENAPQPTEPVEPVDVSPEEVKLPPSQTITTTPDANFIATQTPQTLADMIIKGQIQPNVLLGLEGVDQLKIQEVQALVTKGQLNKEINKERAEVKDATQKYLSDLQSIKSVGGEEAVAQYKAMTADTPEMKNYMDQMNSLTTEINEIDDTLEYMLDDFIEKNPGGDPRALLALSSRARKELIRERNTLVGELELVQGNYNTMYNQRKNEYEVFQAAEAEAKNNELALMSTKYGLTKEQIIMDMQFLEKDIAEVDSVLSGISSTKQLQQEFEKELFMKQLDQEFEMTQDDAQFQRDLARDQVKFEQDIWKMDKEFNYDTVLKNMDIESKFLLKDYDTQSQLAIMRAKHTLDKENKSYSFEKMDDGTLIAVNSKDPSDMRVINPKGGKDYIGSIGYGTVNGWGGVHDNYQGMDIKGEMGDPIPGVKGEVVNVVSGKGQSLNPSYGNYIDIKDEQGYIHRYAHLSETLVNVGDKVDANALIGLMGNSGYTLTKKGDERVPPTPEEWAAGSGKHLDYSVKKPDGTWFNSREIPGYISTIQPIDIDEDDRTLAVALQNIQSDKPGFSTAVGRRQSRLGAATGLGSQGRVTKFFLGEGELGYTRGSKAEGFARSVEMVKNILALPALSQLKGAMSDRDITFIQTSQSTLSADVSEPEFERITEELENILIRRAGASMETILGLEDFDTGSSTNTSNFLTP